MVNCFPIIVLGCFLSLYGSQFSGTTDPTGVKIVITGQGATVYTVSTVSDEQTGYFELIDYPVGVYRVSLTKDGYEDKDTTTALTENFTHDFTLNEIIVPPDTFYKDISGEVSGTWYASDTIYRIIDNIFINDTLIIMGGCTIETYHDTAFVNGVIEMRGGREQNSYFF